MGAVTLKGVRKMFGDFEAIKGIDLEIEDGAFCVLVGPSGCGKSTLLRMIAGLEEISSGELSIAGRVVNDIAPADRQVSMVFQSYALYPHMSVFKNMAFGLRLANTDEGMVEQRVNDVAEILQLTDLLDRKPKELSGGQRQRVAIGRAIVRNPKVFLFDEPLSNLDASLRVQMRLEISRLHRRLGTTMIHVTHDQVEAMTLADTIVVMNAGRVEQVGSPRDLYDRPANTFVAAFIGSPAMNLLSARVEQDGVRLEKAADPGYIHFAGAANLNDYIVTVGIRPEHFEVLEQGTDHEGGLGFEIDVVEDLGDTRVLHGILADGPECTVREPADARKRRSGDRLFVNMLKDSIHVFSKDGRRISA